MCLYENLGRLDENLGVFVRLYENLGVFRASLCVSMKTCASLGRLQGVFVRLYEDLGRLYENLGGLHVSL